jgi:hypothetical protein
LEVGIWSFFGFWGLRFEISAPGGGSTRHFFEQQGCALVGNIAQLAALLL